MKSIIYNNIQKVDDRCKMCFRNGYERLLGKYKVDPSGREEFNSFFEKIFDELSTCTTPEIQRELNKRLYNITGVHDPFENEKAISNKIALKLYNEWKPKVDNSDNPFDLAMRLAVAGNIMDYGAFNRFDIEKTISEVTGAKFGINHSEFLWERIKEAEKILYLGDNAGEIVFDKLFIETMGHRDVTFSVKSAPILNDVTETDATEVGLDKIAKVISNGYDAPSTVLEHCSADFIELYENADIIISKGQGNLEGLMRHNNSRTFFLLMAKCDVIAEVVGVKKGSFLVYNTNIPLSTMT